MSNTITVTGNLGGNPERKKANGQEVTELSVFCDEYKREGDELVENGGQWYRITVWNSKLAMKAFEVLQKGARVTITGHLKGNVYKDKNGEPQLSLDVSAETLAVNLNRLESLTLKEKQEQADRVTPLAA